MDILPQNVDKSQFTNIIQYLSGLFNKTTLTLYEIEGANISKVESMIPAKRFVIMKDEIIENNLRMIESYLPEILFAFSTVSTPKDSISTLILKLSKQGFPYPNPEYSINFLQLKIVYFLETILFADIINSVWEGQLLTNKIYVHKENNELKYYHYYQIRSLLMKLLDKIFLIYSNGIDKGKCHRKLHFSISV